MNENNSNEFPYNIRRKLEEIGDVDILVGISCKNVGNTILHVLNTVSEGLHKYFSEYKKMIVVSDGFSSDRNVELANIFQPYNGIEKIVTEDVVEGGKGAGVKTIFEIARRLDAKVVVLLDGDLLSIKPEWIYEFSSPILYGRGDLVVPYYIRDKYDGVITNNLAYPFTRALYGIDIRQPIAGEYGVSKELYEELINHPLFPYDFGIDIFIVTTASAKKMEVREGIFSLKIHESTTRYVEPETLIVPMFRQVTGEMFELAEYYEEFWKNRGDGRKIPSRKFFCQNPISVSVNIDKIKSYFSNEFLSSKKIIKKILPEKIFKKVEKISKDEIFDSESWAETVYNFASYYKKNKHERSRILDALKTIWLGRFIGYVIETQNMDLNGAETVIQEQAKIFEEKLDYFISIY